MKTEQLTPEKKELAEQFYLELQAEAREKLRNEGEDPETEEQLRIATQGYNDAVNDTASEDSIAFLTAFLMWIEVGTPTPGIDCEARLN